MPLVQVMAPSLCLRTTHSTAYCAPTSSRAPRHTLASSTCGSRSEASCRFRSVSADRRRFMAASSATLSVSLSVISCRWRV